MVEKSNFSNEKMFAPENMSRSTKTEIGKYMTYLLRHGAEKEGLKISSDGYVVL